MAKHFNANEFAGGTANLFGFNRLCNRFNLLECEFPSEHHNVSKLREKAKRLDVRNIKLRGQMHFQPDFSAVTHHSHIGGDDGINPCGLGGVENFTHLTALFIVNDGVDGEVTLNAMLFANARDFF